MVCRPACHFLAQDTLLVVYDTEEGCFWVIAVNFFFLEGKEKIGSVMEGRRVDTFVNWNQTVNKHLEVKSKFFVSMEIR